MRRREFITLFGGTAAWPLATWAQQGERMRRIGALLNVGPDDPMGQAASRHSCTDCKQQAGRTAATRRSVRAGRPPIPATNAAELIALGPDVVLARTTAAVAQLQQASRTVPIVFVSAITDADA